MRNMRVLPQRRSKGWLLWALHYAALLSILLILNRYMVLGSELTMTIVFRLVLLSLGLGFIINGFGWLGARWIWLVTSIGVIFGLVMLFYYGSKDLNGWQDLASFLAFMQGIVFGFALGVIVEIVIYMFRMRANKQS